MSMRVVLGLMLALIAIVAPRAARADEVAPELEGADLRLMAQHELKKLVAQLPANDQKRLTGIYVAFDPSPSDPIAQVACDDDGDYVVLLSDAMLRLVAHVARAESYDEANSSRKVEDYAAFLVRTQVPGRRLLPPPPGFYTAAKPAGSYDERLSDALSFVVARELTHFRAGDHVCPRPTPTKESGDDTWTTAEQRKANEIAQSVYPGRHERDGEATVRVLDAGRTERGALALLRFFTQFEAERVVAVGRFSPTYLAQHPGAVLRAATVKRTSDAHNSSSSDKTTD